MNFNKYDAEDTIMDLNVELYKSSNDNENEFSVFISHGSLPSSGYSKNHLTKFTEIGEVLSQYIEDNIEE